MSAPNPPGSENDISAFATHCHPGCVACRERSEGGLGLRFTGGFAQGVEAEFDCASRYQGYPDRLHGGIVALLLDAAMTHCLFAGGFQGLTAKLEVRYGLPVEIGVRASIRAHVIAETRRTHRLEAEIVQRGKVRATGKAVFMRIGKSRPLDVG